MGGATTASRSRTSSRVEEKKRVETDAKAETEARIVAAERPESVEAADPETRLALSPYSWPSLRRS